MGLSGGGVLLEDVYVSLSVFVSLCVCLPLSLSVCIPPPLPSLSLLPECSMTSQLPIPALCHFWHDGLNLS